MHHFDRTAIGTLLLFTTALGAALSAHPVAAQEPSYQAELVFELHSQHNHAPGIVECPDGGLLVSWYRGSGERRADDVRVMGARLAPGATKWSAAEVWADTPHFPDCNTCLMIDGKQRLWLFWPLILANTWESCLTQYRVSSDYQHDSAPRWEWQGSIPLVPLNWDEKMLAGIESRLAETTNPSPREKAFAEMVKKQLQDKLSGRLGWQPRCKPTVLPSGRILLPLYTDTYSVSIMAISDDQGATWYASEPLVGYGNIQPAVLRRNDGSLVAYMRENGPLEKIRVCESADEGIHWGPVGTIDLPNPGSGLDAVRLANGHFALVYNDTTQGRNHLAVSISDDEGKTWKWTRHLERQPAGAYHYPAIIQGADGRIHCVYSFFQGQGDKEGKSMKHAAFNEAWVQAGD
ncbi:MAG: exo-alpha-sialidase [Pirellulales bacterium]|nr:exo-alpha-sialidase [Pirellulales bacterium]